MCYVDRLKNFLITLSRGSIAGLMGIMGLGLILLYINLLAHFINTAQYGWLSIALAPVVIAVLWVIGKLTE